jgi:hypothetical protein
MKKFSYTEQIVEKYNKSFDENIYDIIDDNIKIIFNGDENDILKETLSIGGKEEFITEFKSIINDYIQLTENNMIGYKYKFANNINENLIDNEISTLVKENEELMKKNFNPFDVFNSEDYIKLDKNTIILNELKYVPENFNLSSNAINKYFSDGCSIKIKYNGEDWQLSFENNATKENYGTSIDSDDVKYKEFIRHHKNFIANFLEGVSNITKISISNYNQFRNIF